MYMDGWSGLVLYVLKMYTGVVIFPAQLVMAPCSTHGPHGPITSHGISYFVVVYADLSLHWLAQMVEG